MDITVIPNSKSFIVITVKISGHSDFNMSFIIRRQSDIKITV